MTINQLRYFVTVGETGSFTKAGKLLHLTQAAVSSAIRDLESECGTALFQRGCTPLVLTEDGALFLGHVRTFLRQFDGLSDIARNLGTERKLLRIGFATLFGTDLFSELVGQYRMREPNVKIISAELSFKALCDQLENDQLDLAIGSIPETVTGSKFNRLTIGEDSLTLCCHSEHPFAWSGAVTMEQAASGPLVLLSDRFTHSKGILSDFRARGLEPNIFHMTDQAYTVERMIEMNAAIGFLPVSVAVRNPLITPLTMADLTVTPVPILLYWAKDRSLPACAQRFVDMAREQYRK